MTNGSAGRKGRQSRIYIWKGIFDVDDRVATLLSMSADQRAAVDVDDAPVMKMLSFAVRKPQAAS